MMAEIQKANILYVDDEAHNLDIFKSAFRRDYNIFTCASAKEAIEILHSNTIDLIITDQRMPEKTGVEFLEEIIPDYPNTIRMILTGFTDMEAIIKAINKGCVFRYITKPWDEKELKLNLDIGIRMHRIEEKNRELITNLKDEVVQQQRVLGLFQKYVPENIINESLKHEDTQGLFAGELCTVTVLFVDIRGFTYLASRHDPKKIVRYLNDYFSIMTECINRRQGNVDKFIGDSVLGIFGAPIANIYSERNAVLCALDMLEALKKFNLKYQDKFNFQTRVGISVNSGEAVLGNIGSETRLEYTAIGDTINVASRIETLTKDKPDTILISESTYMAVKDEVEAELMGEYEIRGKEEKVRLYKVLGKRK